MAPAPSFCRHMRHVPDELHSGKIIKQNRTKSLVGIGALSFATLALTEEAQTTSPSPEEESSDTRRNLHSCTGNDRRYIGRARAGGQMRPEYLHRVTR